MIEVDAFLLHAAIFLSTSLGAHKLVFMTCHRFGKNNSSSFLLCSGHSSNRSSSYSQRKTGGEGGGGGIRPIPASHALVLLTYTSTVVCLSVIQEAPDFFMRACAGSTSSVEQHAFAYKCGNRRRNDGSGCRRLELGSQVRAEQRRREAEIGGRDWGAGHARGCFVSASSRRVHC